MRIHARTPAARSATCILAFLALLACQDTDDAAEGRRTNAPASEGTVFFFDDFLGTSIDSSKWIVLNRLSDQANNEVNCVVPENVSVKDGLLEGVSKYEDRRCEDSVEPPKTVMADSTSHGTIPLRHDRSSSEGAGRHRDLADDLDAGLRMADQSTLHGQYTRAAPKSHCGLV
jgi:hypothetical protein